MPDTIPLSAVVPTRDRAEPLRRALESMGDELLPAEIIVVDASSDHSTRDMISDARGSVPAASRVRWIAADSPGAAAQRNQGCSLATQPVLGFFDDDVVFSENCLALLWNALESDPSLGGVSATITNQQYHSPGFVSSVVFALMNGRFEPTYAGRILGPAINLLPEDRDDLPDVVPVEWLNAGCAFYRRDLVPNPPFDSAFTGYSLMEDVALSLRVARHRKLANVRRARIFHDSRPGAHKADVRALSRMELVNRHYVMTRVLDRGRARDYARLCVWETFQLAVTAKRERLGAAFWQRVRGKLDGAAEIIRADGAGVAAHG
jgi:glycosyltransferase involved in cell wall biosynthesis